MSGLIPMAGLWRGDKVVTLDFHTPHQHVPSPIEPRFVFSLDALVNLAAAAGIALEITASDAA